MKMGQSGYAAGRGEKGNSLDPPDFGDAFLCIAVEAGLEKRRYLLFASFSEAKSLVSATFFTERERPAGTVMQKGALGCDGKKGRS